MSETVMDETTTTPEPAPEAIDPLAKLEARVVELEAKVMALNWIHDEMLGHHIRLAQTKQLLDNPQTRGSLLTFATGQQSPPTERPPL